jgi:hypothetical protein
MWYPDTISLAILRWTSNANIASGKQSHEEITGKWKVQNVHVAGLWRRQVANTSSPTSRPPSKRRRPPLNKTKVVGASTDSSCCKKMAGTKVDFPNKGGLPLPDRRSADRRSAKVSCLKNSSSFYSIKRFEKVGERGTVNPPVIGFLTLEACRFLTTSHPKPKGLTLTLTTTTLFLGGRGRSAEGGRWDGPWPSPVDQTAMREYKTLVAGVGRRQVRQPPPPTLRPTLLPKTKVVVVTGIKKNSNYGLRLDLG